MKAEIKAHLLYVVLLVKYLFAYRTDSIDSIPYAERCFVKRTTYSRCASVSACMK